MDTLNFDREKYDLKSLLDPKYPFLEKFRDKAPGSHKHSQNVADLCEAVALELDIDPIVMRILGMYHDAGKINFPECYYENQNGSGNMHDDLDPMISFHLLTKHISDTALILIQLPEFPAELIEPITQHHGNTILKSLSNKAPSIEEDIFRYRNTSPPKTLEAAVLMICDSTEATIRGKEHDGSLNAEDICDIIRENIDRLENDDQLDEIKLGSLKKIKKALQRDLESKYHKRVTKDYEGGKKLEDEKVDKKMRGGSEQI